MLKSLFQAKWVIEFVRSKTKLDQVLLTEFLVFGVFKSIFLLILIFFFRSNCSRSGIRPTERSYWPIINQRHHPATYTIHCSSPHQTTHYNVHFTSHFFLPFIFSPIQKTDKLSDAMASTAVYVYVFEYIMQSRWHLLVMSKQVLTLLHARIKTVILRSVYPYGDGLYAFGLENVYILRWLTHRTLCACHCVVYLFSLEMAQKS